MVIFNSYVKLPGGVNPDVFHISGSHGSHGSQALETGNIVLERARRLAAKRREAPHGTLGTKRCVGERWPLRARSVVTWMRCSWHRISWNRSNKHGTFIEGWEGSSWNWWCFFYGINSFSSIMLIQNQAEAAKSLGISPESQAPHSFVWS